MRDAGRGGRPPTRAASSHSDGKQIGAVSDLRRNSGVGRYGRKGGSSAGMKIAELIHDLPVTLKRGSPQQDVDAIVEDSRVAAPGCLFVARPGVRVDGHAFIAEAVDAGAVAVL